MASMFSLIPEEGVSLPSPGPEGTVPTLISSCHDFNHLEAMETRMTVPCDDGFNCTTVSGQPGATIVSPLVLSILGVTGQITALVFLSRSTRPQHSRTVFFLLLCNLIWTDLVGKILTTPPAIFTYVHGQWIGGVHLCNYHGFVMMIIGMFTHMLVCAMAIERFLGIRHGYYYSTNITTTRAKMLLLSLWLFVVLFCAMPLFGVGKYALQYPGSWCYIDLHPCGDTALIHRIYTNLYGLLNAISVVILVACNFVVIGTLLRMRLCHNSSLSATAFCQSHRSRKLRELELQTVIVLAVITVVFVASWAPLDMRLFLNQVWPHHTQKDHISDLVAIRLASVNQILDPWVYIICRKLFTSRMWRFMRRLVVSKTWSSLHQSQQQKSPVLAEAPPNPIKPKNANISPVTEALPALKEGLALSAASAEELRHGQTVAPDSAGTPCSRDSGTGPLCRSSRGSDMSSASTSDTSGGVRSGGGRGNGGVDVPVGHLIPIPVFMCEQYRLDASSSSSIKHNRRLRRRIHSSASSPGIRRNARKQPKGRLPGGTASMEHYRDESSRVTASGLTRSSSWCCSKDTSTYKGFRSQSTQTIEDGDEEVEEEEKGCEEEVPTYSTAPSPCEVVVDESSEESVFMSVPEESPVKNAPLCPRKSVGTKERLRGFPPLLPLLKKTGRGHHRQSADGKKYSIIADSDTCMEKGTKNRKRHPKLAEIPCCRAKESSDFFATTTSCPPLYSANDEDAKAPHETAKNSAINRVISSDSVTARTALNISSTAVRNTTRNPLGPNENGSDADSLYKSAPGLNELHCSLHGNRYSGTIDPHTVRYGGNPLDSRLSSSHLKGVNCVNGVTSAGSANTEGVSEVMGVVSFGAGIDNTEIGEENFCSENKNYQRIGTTRIGSASIGLVSDNAEKSSGNTDIGSANAGLGKAKPGMGSAIIGMKQSNLKSDGAPISRTHWPNKPVSSSGTSCRQASEPTRALCRQAGEISGTNYRQASEPTKTNWKRETPLVTKAKAEESEEETDEFCSAYDSFV